ncbi:MAG: PfkB family carbohydrate kinase [bacterium]|nr:PfkB family carbohydrate kinase [bacterium]
MNRKIDCLGLGIIPYDLLYSVKAYPEAEMKIDAESLFMQGGGPVPSVLVGLSRLGFRSAMIGVVGDDPIGRIGVEELKRAKVNTEFIRVRNGKPSAVAAGWVEKGTGRRTLVLGREVFVQPADLKLSRYPIPRLVHLDGRDMPATLKLAKWAKRNGAVVSFDIGSIRNDVSAVFPYVDHLVVADSYAFPFTKCSDVKQAIKKLCKYGSGTVVVTEGIKGSTGYESGEFFYQPAYRVRTVDTTGAGDAFHTGYIMGLLNGASIAERLHLGAAVAAIKCRQPGARTGLPGKAELKKFLSGQPRKYK